MTNFPDTNNNSTAPDPNVGWVAGDKYTTDKGVVYTWTGYSWTTKGSGGGGGGGEGDYLPLTGGDLTGDLTLGTDKIELDASGGSIAAAGYILTGPNTGSGSDNATGMTIDGRTGRGQLSIIKSEDDTGAIGKSFLTCITTDGTPDTKIELNRDGSITAAGNVTSTDGTNYSSLRPGYMVINSPADFGQVIGCYTGSYYSWAITAGGSATFTGDVESNGYIYANGTGSYIVVNRTGATGSTTVAEFGGSTVTSRISADGSGEFAAGNFKIYPSGAIDANSIGIGTPGNYPIVLTSSGDAEFAGRLKTDEYYLSKNTSANASFIAYNNTGVARTDEALLISNNDGSSGQTAAINYDGSATFTDNSSIFAGVNGGSAVFYGGDSSTTDQSNAKFRLNSSGSASFAGAGTFGTSTNGLNNATDTSFRVNSQYLSGEAFNLRANGNATFAGTVKGNSSLTAIIGGEFYGNSTSDAFPAIRVRQFEDAGHVFQGRKADGGITSSINGLGSATFVGDVEVGDTQPWSSVDKEGTYIGAGGGIETYRNLNGAQNGAYSAYYKNPNGTNEKVFGVNMDGSALFSGDLTVKSNVLVKGGNDSGIFIRNKEDTEFTIDLNENGSASFSGTVTSANSFTIQLEADDPTKYDVTTEEYTDTETYEVEVPILRPEGVIDTADLIDEAKTRTVTKEREVTKTREVRTYNGSVLDVKERIQQADDEILNLKMIIDSLERTVQSLELKVNNLSET